MKRVTKNVNNRRSTQTPRKWTPEEDNLLLQSINSGRSLSVSFIAVSKETGRTPAAVRFRYGVLKKRNAATQQHVPSNRWTKQEEDTLLRYVRNSPSLAAAFVVVAEQIGRSKTAVENHWYTVLSKKALAFASIGGSFVGVNRKNVATHKSIPAVWRGLIKLLKLIGL